jgi:hypothetical protein
VQIKAFRIYLLPWMTNRTFVVTWCFFPIALLETILFLSRARDEVRQRYNLHSEVSRSPHKSSFNSLDGIEL